MEFSQIQQKYQNEQYRRQIEIDSNAHSFDLNIFDIDQINFNEKIIDKDSPLTQNDDIIIEEDEHNNSKVICGGKSHSSKSADGDESSIKSKKIK